MLSSEILIQRISNQLLLIEKDASVVNLVQSVTITSLSHWAHTFVYNIPTYIFTYMVG